MTLYHLNTAFGNDRKSLILKLNNFRVLKDEKSKEKLELVQAARNVRQMAKSLIDEMHEEVDTKIKTLAWNSHARQTRALEACARLKKEFDEAIHHHTEVHSV